MAHANAVENLVEFAALVLGAGLHLCCAIGHRRMRALTERSALDIGEQ